MAKKKPRKLPAEETRYKRIGKHMEKLTRAQKKKRFDKTKTLEHSRMGRGKMA